MTDIIVHNTFNRRCSYFGSFNNAMFIGSTFETYRKRIVKLVKNCITIDEVIEVIKKYNKHIDYINNRILYIEVDIDKEKFFLSKELKILSKQDLESILFVPYIKYDLDEKDIRKNTIPIFEQHLFCKCKNLQKQIEAINKYIEKPFRRFKKWAVKPHKLYLYHTYNDNPKEFQIDYVRSH